VAARTKRKRPRGTVGERTSRAGWWCRFWDYRGKRRCVFGGDTEEEARDELARLIAKDQAIRRGERREVTLATFAADDLFKLMSPPRLAPKSYEAFTGRVLRAAEHFGDLAMADVSVAEAEDFLATLTRGGTAPLTVRAYRSALSVAWKAAIRRSAATSNVWQGLAVPKAHERAFHFLDERQLAALYVNTPKPIRAFVSLLGETGMRRGELLALRWRSVDLEGRRVFVTRSKTGRVREVPLPKTARAVFEGMGAGRPERRVFAALGETWHKRNRRLWRVAKRKAKLPANWRLHDLRHSRASLLVRAGVPIPTVARWLGMTAGLVLHRYGHHAPANELDDGLARLEAARRGSAPRRRPKSGAGGARSARSRSPRRP
jgi:integrase